ncbi:unnamed protein product [Eretmochelys imbricata]
MREKQALAQLERETAEREKEAKERHAELEREATEREKEADERKKKAHQMQQEMAKLQLQVKTAMEERQKLYPLGYPVYNSVDMLYSSEQFSAFNQFCYGQGEGDSNLGKVGNSCLSVNEASECLSNVSEVNLELDQAQKELIGHDFLRSRLKWMVRWKPELRKERVDF